MHLGGFIVTLLYPILYSSSSRNPIHEYFLFDIAPTLIILFVVFLGSKFLELEQPMMLRWAKCFHSLDKKGGKKF